MPNYLAKEGKLIRFKGVLTRIEELYQEMLSAPTEASPAQENFFKTYMHETECPDCSGTRMKKIKDYILLNGKSYTELGKMEFSELRQFLGQIHGNEASQPIIDALRERLGMMEEIGLEYLSFERRIDSLSGGEYQRLRIASQLCSGLVGLTYIIDEPTDGLHGADNQKVIHAINKLLQKGNTVITIEHDYDVIKAADYIIELGPGAGVHGGEVIAAGTLEELQSNPNSMTGRYLTDKTGCNQGSTAVKSDLSVKLFGICVNNIKNMDIAIPLHAITCFTGVSGSGKSSVVYEVLYKALRSKLQNVRVVPGTYQRIEGFDKIKNVICINQSPLHGKNTSIPATYLGIFDTIRTPFAESVEDGDEMKDKKSYFSFHSKGACSACKGKGYVEKYIQYFGEMRSVCSECNGRQYREDVLLVKFQGKNIRQVLDLTFEEAFHFFKDYKNIFDRVELACNLGLGYMKLGQPLSTLSGGEAQRIKLVKEMTRYKNRKNLLYIFDEPTVGLHAKDISRIIAVMQRIVDNGNTVVLVEHNPALILNADYIIDLGPGGGKHGGELMFTGTPFQMLRQAHSKTADYLRYYTGEWRI